MLLRRAREEGWKEPFKWCYRESMGANGEGWLSEEDVENKKKLIPAAMWKTEYDLQEPSFEGRAFQTDKVDATFVESLGRYGDGDDEVTVEPPHKDATYATGADWAKQQDYTVIVTFRTDCTPWRMVKAERMRRRPWPLMIARLKTRLEEYPGKCVHDATGLGGVIDDYLETELKPTGEIMTGQNRSSLFSEYVAGLEALKFEMPRIKWMYEQHRYALITDLWGTGHPPDSIVACALAWRSRQVGVSEASVKVVRHDRDWKKTRRRMNLYGQALGW
jgi:hypothetical protein